MNYREEILMINYVRRRRQADENSNIIVAKFAAAIDNEEILYPGVYDIRNDNELMELVQKIRHDVTAKANNIQPDWSIPIILEAIGQMYYGNQQNCIYYGTIFKRSLAYLWKANKNVLADKKNLENLLNVLELCYVLETLYAYRKFFLIIDDFSFKIENGYINYNEEYTSMINQFAALIQGRGKRLRIAEVNSNLMLNKAGNFLCALLEVLSGEEPKNIKVFEGTFYEKIPGISDVECKKFWQSVFFRYICYIETLAYEHADTENEKGFTPSVTMFPEFAISLPEMFFTQEIIQATFWNQDWVKAQEDEKYSNLIVERPIMRITPEGDFATCSVLIGDSINYFIESQILNYSSRTPKINLPSIVFKNAISSPFEDKVINKLRENSFLAGHVTEDGIWVTQTQSINLKWDDSIDLYGEIDVLAYEPILNFAILVECKVLNDLRDYKSYKNIISKLVDDSEGFQSKLLKKGQWVNEALSNYYNISVKAVCVLLTDIPIPILNFHNEDIILTYYDKLISVIKQLLINNEK